MRSHRRLTRSHLLRLLSDLITMSVLQRARDSGKCAPSLLLSHPQQTDVDEFDEGLLRAIDSNGEFSSGACLSSQPHPNSRSYQPILWIPGFQLRPDAQAADDIIPLLQVS